MTIWKVSDDWFDRHTTQDLAYRVRVRAVTPNAMDSAWARIVKEHGSDDDGVVPIGGAALIRVNDHEAEAISGGEDALDSLEWAVNDVLGEALKGAEVLVVSEERSLVFD
ncbi:XRE family transcriptional regulator [Brevibacterium sp. HMSC22B09]|uniref:XRE family transcriptional regulator n=1 Tax=Brevibacterium sp. HMSC22B09 TaxID=1581055 RepID=UPI0008A12D35|nr:XRE family transcriptional regulator [Brevibacterium sp. HMSC22B09]OFT96829.1 XRE family transcriptional regulator [Brevibacterium sp. HMSC22B09]